MNCETRATPSTLGVTTTSSTTVVGMVTPAVFTWYPGIVGQVCRAGATPRVSRYVSALAQGYIKQKQDHDRGVKSPHGVMFWFLSDVNNLWAETLAARLDRW